MDQWEVEELAKVLKKARIMLYSTCLSDAEIKLCRAHHVCSIEEAIANEADKLGRNPEISVLPDGPYALVERNFDSQDI